MAKTPNIDHFICDKCGDDAYYNQTDKGRQDWQDVERFDVNKVKKNYLYCPPCFEAWKKHQNTADANFTTFMKG